MATKTAQKNKSIMQRLGIFQSNFNLGITIVSILAILSACKKDKEIPAVVEEAPAWENNDKLMEEPPLQTPSTANTMKEGAGNSNGQFQANFSEKGRYVVQVSVTKSASLAEHLVSKLADQGFPAYVASVENPTPELFGTYHRVRVGKFATVTDARDFGSNVISTLGYQFWVDNKSNDQMGYAELGSGSSSTSESYTTPSSYTSPAPEPSYSAPSSPASSSPATSYESDLGSSETDWNNSSSSTGSGSSSSSTTGSSSTSSSPSTESFSEPAASSTPPDNSPSTTTSSPSSLSPVSPSSSPTSTPSKTESAKPKTSDPKAGSDKPAGSDDWSDWSTPSDTTDEW